MESFLQLWYFHVPNYLLAALMWTMLGRFLLGLFVPLEWDNYIWQFFRRLTDPVLDLVRRITPSFMVESLLPLVAVFWIFVVRIGWQMLVLPEARAFYLLVLHLLGLVPESWLPQPPA